MPIYKECNVLATQLYKGWVKWWGSWGLRLPRKEHTYMHLLIVLALIWGVTLFLLGGDV